MRRDGEHVRVRRRADEPRIAVLAAEERRPGGSDRLLVGALLLQILERILIASVTPTVAFLCVDAFMSTLAQVFIGVLLDTLLLSKCDYLLKSASAVSEFAWPGTKLKATSKIAKLTPPTFKSV